MSRQPWCGCVVPTLGMDSCPCCGCGPGAAEAAAARVPAIFEATRDHLIPTARTRPLDAVLVAAVLVGGAALAVKVVAVLDGALYGPAPW